MESILQVFHAKINKTGFGCRRSITLGSNWSQIAFMINLLAFFLLGGCVSYQGDSSQVVSSSLVCATPASIDIAEEPLVVPIELVNNIPLIQASVSDLDAGWYVLDTGTSPLVLSQDTASQAAFRFSGEAWLTAFGGRRTVPTVLVDVLTIGDTKFSDFDAAVSDLSGLSITLGRTISGVIGLEVFGSLRVTIDYTNAQLRIASGSGARLGHREPSEIMEVPFSRLGYRGITIPLVVDGEEAHYKLDTGLDCGLLINRQIAENFMIDRDAAGGNAMVTFHGNIPSESGRLLEPVWIGRLGISQCAVTILRETSMQRYVGGDFLKHFSVTIDLETQLVQFELPSSPSSRLVFQRAE